MNTCYICCALDCKIDINRDQSDFVIGADRGYLVLVANGIKPDMVIGDFDSYEGKVACENIIRYPVKKDYTDSQLAIEHALEKGYKKIRIYGAIGGALDHTIANLALLAYYSKKGVDVAFFDEKNVVFAITNSSVEFSPDAKGRISVFPMMIPLLGFLKRGFCTSLTVLLLVI